MQEEFEKLVNEQLTHVLSIVSEVFNPPPEVFRQHCYAAFASLIYQGENLERSKAEFDALCLTMPSMPRDAVRDICLAYAVLKLYLDDKKGWTDIGAAITVQSAAFATGGALGLINGSASTSPSTQKAARRLMAQQGAHAFHTLNRAKKDDAFQWLDSNFSNFKSMDAAAEKLSTDIVDVTFRTARSYVTEWKKLRPASTP